VGAQQSFTPNFQTQYNFKWENLSTQREGEEKMKLKNKIWDAPRGSRCEFFVVGPFVNVNFVVARWDDLILLREIQEKMKDE